MSTCRTRPTHSLERLVRLVGLAIVVSGCGDDEVPETSKRGLPAGTAPLAPTETSSSPASGREPSAQGESGEGEPSPGAPSAKRPRPVLTREDFGPGTRDPFQSFIGTQVVELAPDRPRAQRDVKIAQYAFEDLRLVAIVHSGRNVVPRALFVATDGKSKAIKQGEYFSRAEVLLAAVNRDYVEIEVIDEALASNLNMARGERRAIYLKNQ